MKGRLRARSSRRAHFVLAFVLMIMAVSVPITGVTTLAIGNPKPAAALGNAACGTETITPNTNVTGGYTYNATTVAPTTLTITINWLGTPSNGGCTTLDAEGPGSLPWYQFGTGGIHAGYWLVGLFCSTLAQTASNPENYCDLAHGFVMTDDNSGPNDPNYNSGTSYNVCTTVAGLAQLQNQTIPQCLTDGNRGGWTENWPKGSTTGTLSGPAPESNSNTPWASNVANTPASNCPPSQAEVEAGAVFDTCVFAISELDWYYYCVAGICLPDFGNVAYPYPNGENVPPNNNLAALYTYQFTNPTDQVTTSPTVIGDTVPITGSGWGPAVSLSSGAGTLTGRVCWGPFSISNPTATTCSTNSVVTLTEAATGGTLTGTAKIGSDVGTNCTGGTCYILFTSPNTQIENGWEGPWTDWPSATFTVLGPPGLVVAPANTQTGTVLTASGVNFDPAGTTISWLLKNTTTGSTYPTAACPVPGQPQPQAGSVTDPVVASGPGAGNFTGTLLLALCIVPDFSSGSIVAIATQTSAGGLTETATSAAITLTGNLNESENTPNEAQAVLSKQPLAFWTLGDASGSTTAADSSGNFNTGTVQGAVTFNQPGPLAGPSPPTAAGFDGATGYVSTLAQYVDPLTFSIGAWFKTTAPQGDIIGFNNTDTASPTEYDRMIYVGTDGKLHFGIYNGATNVISSANTVDDGAWHLAIATFTGGTASLYLDGQSVGSLTGITGVQNYTGYWTVGASNNNGWPNGVAGASYFNGSIADAAVYPTALGLQDAILQWGFGTAAALVPGSFDSIYRQAVLNQGPVGMWPMSEVSGTAVTDLSGNGNTGTYVGSPTLGAAGPISVMGDTDTSVTLTTGGQAANVPQSLASPANVSVGVWFKTTGTSQPVVSAMSCAAPCATTTAAPLLWVGANGDLKGNLAQNPATTLDSGYAVNDGRWHFAVVTGGASGTTLYLDGLATTSSATTPNLAGLGNLTFGYLGQGINEWSDFGPSVQISLSGALAQGVEFPSQLSAPQVALIYASGETTYAGANVTMSPVTLGAPGQSTSVGVLEPVTVNSSSPTITTWTVTGEFTAPFSNTSASGPLVNNQIPVANMSFSPTVVTASGATLNSLGTDGVGPTSMAGFTAFAQGVPSTLCTATGTGVAGQVSGGFSNCGAVLKLVVPPTASAGTYTSTLQITIS